MTASAALLIAGILAPAPAPVEPYREPAFLAAVQDASATTALAVQVYRRGPMAARPAIYLDLLIQEQELMRFPSSPIRDALLASTREGLRALSP